MDAIGLPLVGLAAVLLLGALGKVVHMRAGVPSALLLAGCGVVLGPLTGWIPRQHVLAVLPALGSLLLVVALSQYASQMRVELVGVIMQRRWRPQAVITAITLGAACVLVALGTALAQATQLLPSYWGWAHTLLLAVVLAPPCVLAASSLACAGHGDTRELKPGVTDQWLVLEASVGSVVTALGASLLVHALLAAEAAWWVGLLSMVLKFSLGITAGCLLGAGWVYVLHVLNAPSQAYVVTLAAALLVYAIATYAGINAIAALLAFGITLGNAAAAGRRFGLRLPALMNRRAEADRARVIELLQAVMWLTAGMLITSDWDLLVLGLLLAVLLLVSRVPSVVYATRVKLLGTGQGRKHLLAGTRGWVSLGLGVLPMQQVLANSDALVTTVAVVLITMAAVQWVGKWVGSLLGGSRKQIVSGA